MCYQSTIIKINFLDSNQISRETYRLSTPDKLCSSSIPNYFLYRVHLKSYDDTAIIGGEHILKPQNGLQLMLRSIEILQNGPYALVKQARKSHKRPINFTSRSLTSIAGITYLIITPQG